MHVLNSHSPVCQPNIPFRCYGSITLDIKFVWNNIYEAIESTTKAMININTLSMLMDCIWMVWTSYFVPSFQFERQHFLRESMYRKLGSRWLNCNVSIFSNFHYCQWTRINYIFQFATMLCCCFKLTCMLFGEYSWLIPALANHWRISRRSVCVASNANNSFRSIGEINVKRVQTVN